MRSQIRAYREHGPYDDGADRQGPSTQDAPACCQSPPRLQHLGRQRDHGRLRPALLTIYVIDLAPRVGASLAVMDQDTKRMRGAGPFVFFQPQDGTGPGRHHGLHRTGRHAAGGL